MTQTVIEFTDSFTNVIELCDAYVRVFQSKQLYAVETQTGEWYVINSKKNRYNGKYYGNIPFQCTTVIPTPLYMIDLIFPSLKDNLVLTPWLLSPEQQ